MENGARPALVVDPSRSADASPASSSGPACWPILPAPASGWPQLAMGVWELKASSWGDCHPHDEVSYVLAGTLVVECDGLTLEGGPGDTIRVPAGLPARYHAPEYARVCTFTDPIPKAGRRPPSPAGTRHYEADPRRSVSDRR